MSKYRVLKKGEIIEEGDEYMDSLGYTPVKYNLGEVYFPEDWSSPIRRPVESAKQYRSIATGEIYKEGDEVSCNGVDWELAYVLMGSARRAYEDGGFKYARRLIKPSPAPLGLEPRKLHDEARHKEVLAAIQRYIKAGLPIPSEWWDEHIDYLESA